MKLKDIKGFPKEIPLDIIDNGRMYGFEGYKIALSEIGEKELVVDVEKVFKAFENNLSGSLNGFRGETILQYTVDDIKRVAQAIAKADIFKVEEEK